MYDFLRLPLTNEEVDRLCNACETFEEKLIVLVLLDTGLRIGELCSLTKNDIQYQQRQISIIGKGKKRRVVPMTDRVAALLSNYFAQHNNWFVQVRQAQNILKNVANRAQILSPCSPHVLRHTFAINCINKGISERMLQNMLGHSSIITTSAYLNITDPIMVDIFRSKCNV